MRCYPCTRCRLDIVDTSFENNITSRKQTRSPVAVGEYTPKIDVQACSRTTVSECTHYSGGHSSHAICAVGARSPFGGKLHCYTNDITISEYIAAHARRLKCGHMELATIRRSARTCVHACLVRDHAAAIGHRFGVTASTGGGFPTAGGQTHLTGYG